MDHHNHICKLSIYDCTENFPRILLNCDPFPSALSQRVIHLHFAVISVTVTPCQGSASASAVAAAAAMDRTKISFAVGAKRKASGFDQQPANSESDPSALSKRESAPQSEQDAVFIIQSSINDQSPGNSLEGPSRPTLSPGLRSNYLKAGHTTLAAPLPQQSETSRASKSTKNRHEMAEPLAKRAKRTDSSAMWERNSARSADAEHKSRSTNEAGSTREKRDEREKRGDRERPDERDRRDERDRHYGRDGHHGRDDRRHRSRSRERAEKRRERSRSRERARDRDRDGRSKRSRSRDKDGGRHKNGDRGDDREKRDRRRSTSRDRHRSRRGM